MGGGLCLIERGGSQFSDGIGTPQRTRRLSGKAQVQEVGGNAAEDQKQNLNFQLANKPSWVSPKEVLQSRLIDTVYHLLVNNDKGEGGLIERGVGLFTFFSLKAGLI